LFLGCASGRFCLMAQWARCCTAGVCPWTPASTVLTSPEPAVVAEIHRAYIDAGADIIETNSFGANRFKLAEYSLQQQVRQD
jgi:methionine synthase I (cobalamin-dependent)